MAVGPHAFCLFLGEYLSEGLSALMSVRGWVDVRQISCEPSANFFLVSGGIEHGLNLLSAAGRVHVQHRPADNKYNLLDIHRQRLYSPCALFCCPQHFPDQSFWALP